MNGDTTNRVSRENITAENLRSSKGTKTRGQIHAGVDTLHLAYTTSAGIIIHIPPCVESFMPSSSSNGS